MYIPLFNESVYVCLCVYKIRLPEVYESNSYRH